MALLGIGAIAPGCVLLLFAHRMVHFGSGVHFYGVGVSALAAAWAALALSISGARRNDGGVVLVGTGFTMMAALLAVHGLATPGVIVGMNGLVMFTGAATLPVGGAVLALSALPSLRRPYDVRALVELQAVCIVSIATLGIVGVAVPGSVPSMPQPGSPPAIAALATASPSSACSSCARSRHTCSRNGSRT